MNGQVLLLNDLYEYDVSACNYNLLKNLGWDLQGISKNDKLKRNIQIGLLQKENPKLGKFLYDTTYSLISHYLSINKIPESDIILRQRDGFVTQTPLKILDSSLPLDYRGMISKLIFALNSQIYMKIYSNGEVSVKGISNLPLNTSFYNMFANIDYSSKTTIIKGVKGLYKKIIEGENISWYIFEKDDSCMMPIKSGHIAVSKSFIQYLDVSEINTYYLWDNYVWPFVQSLLIHIVG